MPTDTYRGGPTNSWPCSGAIAAMFSAVSAVQLRAAMLKRATDPESIPGRVGTEARMLYHCGHCDKLVLYRFWHWTEDEIMGIFQLALIVATFLCTLVAGFVFAFAVVVMPGIGKLGDGGFLRTFQVMDRVIQNNQPVFTLVWMGSVVALLAAAALGMGDLDGTGRLLLIAAVLVYILGVQLPTVTINVPLNNTVQTLEIDAMDEPSLKAARQDFESRWNTWNSIRTVLASLVSVLLIILLLRL